MDGFMCLDEITHHPYRIWSGDIYSKYSFISQRN